MSENTQASGPQMERNKGILLLGYIHGQCWLCTTSQHWAISTHHLSTTSRTFFRKDEKEIWTFYRLNCPLVQRGCTNRSHQAMGWNGYKSRCSRTWWVPGEYNNSSLLVYPIPTVIWGPLACIFSDIPRPTSTWHCTSLVLKVGSAALGQVCALRVLLGSIFVIDANYFHVVTEFIAMHCKQ